MYCVLLICEYFDLVVVMKCWDERFLRSFWCYNLKLKIDF